MKIIEINSCDECPNAKYEESPGSYFRFREMRYFCLLDSKQRDIKSDTIPKWCPLEDK